jgi:hypothetical protein
MTFPQPPSPLLTTRQAATLAGVSLSAVRQAIARGKLATAATIAGRNGPQNMIDPLEVLRWLRDPARKVGKRARKIAPALDNITVIGDNIK